MRTKIARLAIAVGSLVAAAAAAAQGSNTLEPLALALITRLF